MNNETINRYILPLVVLAMLGTFFAIIMLASRPAYGSAPSGLPATIASTSPYAIPSRTSTFVVATSTCATRVVSTTDKQIMLTFTDSIGQVPTGTFGHMQVASTTVAYDSGQYGCGAIRVWADAATNLTITEAR